MKFEIEKLFWKNNPKQYEISDNKITMVTEPNTDLWQKTFYGFCNDNAPALLKTVSEKYFSFVVKIEFNTKKRYDQCEVTIYQDSNNWLKASVEYENEEIQRLGSVVTNNGYSDWATTDIPASIKHMYYRLSRRESDYCIENSTDGINFNQMRIFHLFSGQETINIGLYACSPEKSSFKAIFTKFEFTECKWSEHK